MANLNSLNADPSRHTPAKRRGLTAAIVAVGLMSASCDSAETVSPRLVSAALQQISHLIRREGLVGLASLSPSLGARPSVSATSLTSEAPAIGSTFTPTGEGGVGVLTTFIYDSENGSESTISLDMTRPYLSSEPNVLGVETIKANSEGQIITDIAIKTGRLVSQNSGSEVATISVSSAIGAHPPNIVYSTLPAEGYTKPLDDASLITAISQMYSMLADAKNTASN